MKAESRIALITYLDFSHEVDCINNTDIVSSCPRLTDMLDNTKPSQSTDSENNSKINCTHVLSDFETNLASEGDFKFFTFKSKGIHAANLNIRHLIPKVVEIRLMVYLCSLPCS